LNGGEVHEGMFEAGEIQLLQRQSQDRRDGAFDWGKFEDAAFDGRFVETFPLDSRMEHLRQHERITNARSRASGPSLSFS
jgi:hypothetical protein